MHKLDFKNDVLVNLILFFLIILSFFITSNIYFGTDRDISGILNSYIQTKESGVYYPSRFYGHPVPELLIGYLLEITNYRIAIFFFLILYFLSLILIFKSFCQNINKSNNSKHIKLFLILCLSNSQLFYDNVSISDYPLSLFFFSLGTYFLKVKEDQILSIIFLGFSVGCRLNFALFAIILILIHYKSNYKLLIKNFFLLLILSSLFYFPIFIKSYLTLDFISNKGGPPVTFDSLLPRFLYKTIDLIGFFSLLFIVFASKSLDLKIYKKHINEIFLIISNLLVFLFIPTKTSIISLFLILLYIILIKNFSKKQIIFLIFFNLLISVVDIQLIKIKYLNKNFCDSRVAISGKVHLNFSKGKIFKFHDKSKNNYKCILKETKKFNKYF